MLMLCSVCMLGTAKLAAQAKSREKMVAKMVAGGMTERVEDERNFEFRFPECERLAPPIIMIQQISFQYGADKAFHPPATNSHLSPFTPHLTRATRPFALCP